MRTFVGARDLLQRIVQFIFADRLELCYFHFKNYMRLKHMKIIKSYAGEIDCMGGKCPSLHCTDDGRIVVQGRRLSESEKSTLSVPSEEDVVSLDLEVFRKLVAKLNS